MNKKDLKRLRRRDLLEMLLDLTKENGLLRERNDELEAQLQDRMLIISEAGTLAEAALRLNGVIKAAQDACDQYTYNMQLRCQRMEEETKAKCMQMLNECRHQSGRYEKEDSE
jgi:hypothetical protein